MDIRFVDAGGGLGIQVAKSADFDAAASARTYLAVMAASRGLKAHLLLEPWFLILQAGDAADAGAVYEANWIKTFVITDAGMNDLIRPALYQAHHEIWPVVRSARAEMVADIVGPVCESGDFFAKDRSLAEVRAGELVVLLDAGAYGMSLSSHYNTRVRPAEVLVESGVARLVRRRETVEELLGVEAFSSGP